MRKNIVPILALCTCLIAGCGAQQKKDTDTTTYESSEEQKAEQEQSEETRTNEQTSESKKESQTEMIYDFNQFQNVVIEGIDISSLEEKQQEVLYQYARYSEAMTDADMEVLDEMITEESNFTHISGRTQTKQEYMADIEDGSLNYITVEIQNPQVVIDGDKASVNCTTVLTANAYGARGSWPFRGTRSFEKRDGKWKVVNR